MSSVGVYVRDLIFSVGGIGVIIVGLSSVVTKICVEIYMKKKNAIIDKDHEKYKSELETERDKYKAEIESAIYRNRIMFEKELEVYQKVIKLIKDIKIVECDVMNYNGNNMEQLYDKAKEKCNDLINIITSNGAIVDAKIDKDCEEFVALCIKNMNKYVQNDNRARDVKDLTRQEIDKMQEDIRVNAKILISTIREHIKKEI